MADPASPGNDDGGSGDEAPANAEGLQDITGVGPAKAEALREAGFESVADVRAATIEELSEATGVGEDLAGRIKDDVGDGGDGA